MPVSEMLSTHPFPPHNAALLASCIKECFICAAVCSSCADACLAEPDLDHLRRCISLNLSCADTCIAAGRTTTRFTADDPAFYHNLISSCAEICGSCAAECEKHASMHKHCRVCAEQCRKCETVCQQVGTSGAGTSMASGAAQ